MTVIKRLGVTLALGAVAAAALFIAARYHDGPIAMIPGGPLRAGELVTVPVDHWAFAAGTESIELALAGTTTSRSTWILVHHGNAYVPARLGFPPGKWWRAQAQRHGDALIRIRGKRYPVHLERIRDDAVRDDLARIVREKYGGTDVDVWYFRVTSRPA